MQTKQCFLFSVVEGLYATIFGPRIPPIVGVWAHAIVCLSHILQSLQAKMIKK